MNKVITIDISEVCKGIECICEFLGALVILAFILFVLFRVACLIFGIK